MVSRIVTLGDSTLDSCRYSGGRGTSAPELLARALDVDLEHLARDGHTANAVLTFQLPGLPAPASETVLVVSVGGNDLLSGIYSPADIAPDFARRLDQILVQACDRLRPTRTVVANIYDPSGHDPNFAKWFTDIDRARAIHAAFNEVIAAAATSHGATLADLCKAFRETAGCSPPWITARIEPSAEGARQIARLLREAIEAS